MTATSTIQAQHNADGFTLLEVLAATMIFAMVMTVLISTSSTAVHHAGTSARRLEASLLAEEILVGLEIQMKQGIAPEIDQGEFSQDPYSIRLYRTDLIPDEASTDPGAIPTGVVSMLGAGLPEVAKHLKQYDIEVSWFEQNGPQSVTRTTFAFDWQTAAIEFSELFARNSGGADGNSLLGGGGGVLGGNGGGRSNGDDAPGVLGGVDPRDPRPGGPRGPGGSRDGHNARNNYRRPPSEN